MFKNILTKTIYERRWTMVLWSVGVILMSLLMMAFYHSFSGGNFDELLKNLPKSFQGIVGNLASLKTVPGYVSQEVFALRIPLLTLIMGVVLFSGLLASDEEDGKLQSLLAQPVTRLSVFAQKFLAGAVISLVICLSAVPGVLLGLFFIHEKMGLLRLFQASFGAWLLTITFGAIGYALGAATGKRGLSGSLAGLVAFSTYLITSFVASVSWLKPVEHFSPFHYYNNPSIAEFGLKGTNMLILGGIILVSVIVSAWVFNKRDIYQR